MAIRRLTNSRQARSDDQWGTDEEQDQRPGPPASWQWLWRAFAPAGDHEEFGDLRPECLAEALQHSHGRILKAPLEPAHVGPIDLSVDRKDFLGKPSTHS